MPCRSSISFMPRGHLFEFAKAIYGAGTDLARQWGNKDATNSIKAASVTSSPPFATMPQPARRQNRASTTSETIAAGCRIPGSGPWVSRWRPAQLKAVAKMSSKALPSAAGCTGPSAAPTRSSRFAAQSEQPVRRPLGAPRNWKMIGMSQNCRAPVAPRSVNYGHETGVTEVIAGVPARITSADCGIRASAIALGGSDGFFEGWRLISGASLLSGRNSRVARPSR